ncbi:hypothetical protein WDU94_006382 [Cyamophila willieti]
MKKADENNIMTKDDENMTKPYENMTTADENMTIDDENMTKDFENMTKADENMTKDDENKTKVDENMTKDDENVTTADENMTIDDENLAIDHENMTKDFENMTKADENMTKDDENKTTADENMTIDDEYLAIDHENMTKDDEVRVGMLEVEVVENYNEATVTRNPLSNVSTAQLLIRARQNQCTPLKPLSDDVLAELTPVREHALTELTPVKFYDNNLDSPIDDRDADPSYFPENGIITWAQYCAGKESASTGNVEQTNPECTKKVTSREVDSPIDDRDADPSYFPENGIITWAQYCAGKESASTGNVEQTNPECTKKVTSREVDDPSEPLREHEPITSTGNSDQTIESTIQTKRRKKSNPALWGKNIAKTLRNSGREYTSMNTRKNKPARSVKPGCDVIRPKKKKKKPKSGEDNGKAGRKRKHVEEEEESSSEEEHRGAEEQDRGTEEQELVEVGSCRLGCTGKIPGETRETLLNQFWALGCIEKQRCYLQNLMEEIVPKYKYVKSDGTEPRSNNRAFFFEIDGERIQVCRIFFLNTLDISNKMAYTAWVKKRDADVNSRWTDRRGSNAPTNKTPEDIMKSVREHIDSIPRIESHYCRSRSKREYIEGGRSIAEIYSDYKANRERNNLPYASETVFRCVFKYDYNISFHIPKKDQCELCERYKNATLNTTSSDSEDCEDEEERKKKEEEKAEKMRLLKEQYEVHLIEKDLARGEKDELKEQLLTATRNNESAGTNTPNKMIMVVYDLQAVLQCPRGNVSSLYYKSKVNCFNLTFYNIGTKEADCFFWNETEGNRGPDEIGSCIYKYLLEIDQKATGPVDIIFVSDNCAGQQKNKYILALYSYAVSTLPNIQSIQHKFLITGHTQNEGDSVHSVIERSIDRALKSGPIYSPDQYVQIIRSAKKEAPYYRVHEMTFEDFYSLKALFKDIKLNFPKRMNMSSIKTVDVRQNDKIKVRHSYTDTEMVHIDTKRTTDKVTLKRAFSKLIPLKPRKKEDIVEMMNKNIIPPFYKYFYNRIL